MNEVVALAGVLGAGTRRPEATVCCCSLNIWQWVARTVRVGEMTPLGRARSLASALAAMVLAVAPSCAATPSMRSVVCFSPKWSVYVRRIEPERPVVALSAMQPATESALSHVV